MKHSSSTPRALNVAAALSPRPSRRRLRGWCVRLLCFLVCCGPLLQSGLFKGGRAHEPAGREALAASSANARAAKRRGGRVVNEVLLRFRDGATEQEASALAEARGLRREGRLRGPSGVERIIVPEGMDAGVVAQELSTNPAIEFAEPNYVITADQLIPRVPSFPEQRTPQAASLFGRPRNIVAKSDPSRARQLPTRTNRVVIAVIDSGIDFTNRALGPFRWTNRAEKPNGVDDSADGYADDFNGWDFVTDSNQTADESGHGTAVAGVIAAQGNNEQGASWRPRLMSLRVLDAAGSGDVAAAVEAIDYAVAHGAQVINLSWGADAPSLALKAAVERAASRNVVVVSAAGNNGKDLDSAPRYPAAWQLPQTISVAAVNNSLLLTRWSNWGASSVAVAAPGEEVRTLKTGGAHAVTSGTSASAAAVTGLAAVLRARRPGLSAAQTRELITGSVRRLAGLYGKVSAGGVVDETAALDALSALPPSKTPEPEAGDGDDATDPEQTGSNPRPKRGTLGSLPEAATGGAGSNLLTSPKGSAAAQASNLPDLNAAKLRSNAPTRVLTPVPSKRPRYQHRQESCCQGAGKAPSAKPAPTPSAAPTPRPRAGLTRATDSRLASLTKQSLFADIMNALGGRPPDLDLAESDYYSPGGGYSVSDTWTGLLPLALATTPAPDAPTNLAVTSTSSTQVSLSWSSSAGASSYQVERSPSASGTYTVVGSTPGLSFNDTTVANGNAYLYRVRATSGASTSPSSNLALGTAISFTDPTLTAQVTTIKAQHIYDLRTAVNAARRAANLADATWTDLTLTGGVTAKAAHIQQLRDRLDEALSALNISVSPFTDPALSTGATGTLIKRVHVEELRLRSTRGAASGSFGGGSGLTSRYYDNLDFTDFKFGRVDTNVNFNWGDSSPHASLGPDQFSVRWLGFVQARHTQTYTFYTTSDDGVRVWVNGQLIIDNWTDHASTENSGVITLEAGVLTPIKVEFFENFGGALMRLEWASASQPREVVPQGQLYPCWKDTQEFITTFYQQALGRAPTTAELQDWTNTLMQAQGETQLVQAAGTLGRALFTSAEYAARNQSDNQLFVYHSYKSYLQREPDQSGWNFWTNEANLHGREAVLAAFEGSPEFSEKSRRLCDLTATGYNFSTSRLDPINRTGGGGVDPLSRNFNWTLPLVSLPGRADHDLGLTLAYNSLVWTRDGGGITFDADRGTPSPGFRLGFPVVQPRFFDPQTSKDTFLLITPTGARVGLRRVGASNVFESADSSYLQLTDNGPSLVLLRTDGTRLVLALSNGEYRTTEIKDRNGNTISASYDNTGQLLSVVDTLGRTLTFNYDQFQNLVSITQPWKRENESGAVVNETHTWASFSYADKTLQPSFNGLSIVGPQPGTVIPVVQRVGIGDGSYYKFEYTDWGQVWKVTHFAADSVVNNVAQDTHALSATRYNVPGSDLAAATAQTDCPRFTEQRVWVENGVMNQSEEVTTSFTPWAPWLTFCDVVLPDGTLHKEFYGSGWKKGLTTEAHVYSADNLSAPKKRTVVTWTQDDENLPYQQNPRAAETNVYDEAGNRSRTTVTYDSFGLPRDVTEFAADAATPLRTTRTDYNFNQAYLDRRIIGLPAFEYVYAGTPDNGALASKVGYVYDDTSDASFMVSLPAPAAGHDGDNYPATFRTRGHVNRVRRYDVTGAASSFTETRLGYNAAGSLLFSRDPGGHQTNIGYADTFYEGVNRDALGRPAYAYPTTLADADNHSTSVEYNYDSGAMTRSTNPNGAVLRTRYDGAGRVVRTSRHDGAAEKGYTRLVYPTDMRLVQGFMLFDEGQTEAYSATLLDGAGRVRAVARSHPGSAGGYSGQFFDYDIMGRLVRQSNPTETNSAGSWPATGDDATTGWLYRQHAYDWQGRVTSSVNTDGTTKTADFSGCGCAGGAVVTLTDEVGRKQRVISDALGREFKIETLNPDGSVYHSIVNTLNARDQVTRTRDSAGAEPAGDSCPSGSCQETVIGYDGHGRVTSRKTPVESSATTYVYNDDDTLQRTTDARGAAAVFGYNARHLVTSINYEAAAGMTASPAVGFDYDGAGNRLWMTDGLGRVDYVYDTFSQLRTETRQFNGLGSFPLNYDYNFAGELKSITDPTGNQISYTYDHVGRVTQVTGTPYGNVSTYASGLQYRAFGGLKQLTYGNNLQLSVGYNSRLLVQRYEVGNRPTQFGPPTAMLTQISYYTDGLARFADDGVDDRFDRAWAYDHVGRLKEAYTGQEAHDFVDNVANTVQDGPYRQSYQYDVWGNLTRRDTRFWTQFTTFTGTYVNNRRQEAPWLYDAAGHLTQDDDLQYTWDAAGHTRNVRSHDNSTNNTQEFDGDGEVGKRVEQRVNSFPQTTTTYFVRSSVLGARIVTEINGQGIKQKGFVYLWGEVLAEQTPGQPNIVNWRHTNPVTGSQGQSSADGFFWTSVEADPTGVNVGVEDPNIIIDPGGFIPQPETPMLFPLFEGSGCGSNPNCTRCYLDGFEIGCDRAMHLRDIGAAEFQTWTIVRVTYESGRVETFAGYTNLPPGLNITFRGGEAVVAGATFEFWMPNFSFAVPTAIGVVLAGRMESPDGVADLFRGFASSFAPQTSQPAPSSHYPGFDKDHLKTIQDALTKAKEIIGKSDCQKALAEAGIDVAEVIKKLNNLKPRAETDPSFMGFNMFRADQSTEPAVMKFIKSEKGKGAGAFIAGQSIMVRDKFFGGRSSSIDPTNSRAIALIHEAIHLTNKKDADFGGSSKLNDVIIKGCVSRLFGHKDLAIVVP